MINMFYKIKDLMLCKVNGEYGEKAVQGDKNTQVFKVSNLMNDGSISFEEIEERFIKPSKLEKSYLRKGDILIAKSGNPKCVLFDDEDNRYVACNFILVVRPNLEIVEPKYLYYSIRRLFHNELISDCFNQVTIQNLNIPSFLEKEIKIPSLENQKLIIQEIEEIEKVLVNSTKQISLMEELIEATFVDFFGSPVKNEKGHKTITLANIGSLKNGMNFNYDDSGVEINCLGVGDFKDHSFIDEVSSLPSVSLNSMPQEDYLLKNEDIVFVRSNGNKALVGRSVMVRPENIDVTFSGFCIRFRNSCNELNNYYLLYYFKNKEVRELMAGRGANIQNLNQQILSKLVVPIPDMKLQSKFEDVVKEVSDAKLLRKKYYFIFKKIQTHH